MALAYAAITIMIMWLNRNCKSNPRPVQREPALYSLNHQINSLFVQHCTLPVGQCRCSETSVPRKLSAGRPASTCALGRRPVCVGGDDAVVRRDEAGRAPVDGSLRSLSFAILGQHGSNLIKK